MKLNIFQYYVGWVEPSPGIVGFRWTLPNLLPAGAITKRETQQRSISDPGPESFFPEQTGRFFRPKAVLICKCLSVMRAGY